MGGKGSVLGLSVFEILGNVQFEGSVHFFFTSNIHNFLLDIITPSCVS